MALNRNKIETKHCAVFYILHSPKKAVMVTCLSLSLLTINDLYSRSGADQLDVCLLCFTQYWAPPVSAERKKRKSLSQLETHNTIFIYINHYILLYSPKFLQANIKMLVGFVNFALIIADWLLVGYGQASKQCLASAMKCCRITGVQCHNPDHPQTFTKKKGIGEGLILIGIFPI